MENGCESGVGREQNGRFKPGNGGGPGRPRRVETDRYLRTLVKVCSLKDWEEIAERAVKDAKAGDKAAREWLSNYLLGRPVQRIEATGEDGGPIRTDNTGLSDEHRAILDAAINSRRQGSGGAAAEGESA